MSTADKWIRGSTIAAVVVVAAVAASFSYEHALEVFGEHSRPSPLNYVAPLCIDGLIYAGSMVLLNDARRGLDAHPLAWFALGLGIAATLTVNVVSGLSYGIVGAVVAAWPAVALVLSYELLMIIVRRSAHTASAPEPERVFAAPPLTQVAPADSEHAARLALSASVAAGNPLSQRKVMERFGLSRAAERRVRQAVLAESNGHAGSEATPAR